jgi:hypothetical protein
MNRMTMMPPIVSMEMTIGLEALALDFHSRRDYTYDFHSKYAPPPETGINNKIKPIDAVVTPQ